MPPHKKKGIPDRWEDYQAAGKRIPGTRFISFKVPLKQVSVRCFSSVILEKDGQELGLIIDLTFTTRYYKPEDLPDSVFYLKIFTAGHEIPSDSTILSFKRAVCRFLRDNTDNDKLIGVHCTHGLNRTGYLVCRYLIDVDGMDPNMAVELFNSSRGHSIERKNYLQDLQTGPKRRLSVCLCPSVQFILICSFLLSCFPPSLSLSVVMMEWRSRSWSQSEAAIEVILTIIVTAITTGITTMAPLCKY
uniref:RNA/RNP complex-1-interacting phosphatase n=1 Tax=Esox lucius TaxID=8010 RepID=A0AAY5KC13_ESOLU